MAYQKENWNQEEPYKYWTNIEKNAPVSKHPGSIEFMDIVLKKIADEGLDSGLSRKFLKETYNYVLNKF